MRSRFDFVRCSKRLRRGIADLLFPPSCVSCAVELDETTRSDRDVRLCDDCLDEMEVFSEPMCVRCGAPVPGIVADERHVATQAGRRAGCYRCGGRKLWFDETVALGHYEGRLREIVLRMKRAEGDSLSLAMGRLMVAQARSAAGGNSTGCCCPDSVALAAAGGASHEFGGGIGRGIGRETARAARRAAVAAVVATPCGNRTLLRRSDGIMSGEPLQCEADII